MSYSLNIAVIYTLSIGSNEHREENLSLARPRLKEWFPDIRFSTEMETVPLYFFHSPLFSNQVARFASAKSAVEITAYLKAIEREAGRTPDEKAREIVRLDIDLLMCDNTVYRPDDLRRDYIRWGLEELEK